MDLISILQYFGITPDRLVPLLISSGVILYVVYRFISPVKKSVTRLTNATIEIQTVFESTGTILRHHMVESPGSPLRPTEYGKNLIVESGLERIINDKNDYLKKKISERLDGNDTEYDVQETARNLMLELKGDDMMNPVKKYAYENGINVDFILKAGGLWLRDDYLGVERGVNKN